MKKLFLVSVLLSYLLVFSCQVGAIEKKIQCDCVYGEKITENFMTKQILEKDESLINKKLSISFFIDSDKKLIFDGERKPRKVISFTEDKIFLFDVNKLTNGVTNAEIWKINRNNGYIEGSIIFETGNTRITTGVYGECAIVKDKPKF